jgi:hypothetical protein
VPYHREPGHLPLTNTDYYCFNLGCRALAALWLCKYTSRRTPFPPLNPDLTAADFLMTSRLALIIDSIYATYPALQMPGGAFRRVDNAVNRAVVTGILPAVPGYVFPHYTLFENVQSISNDGNGDARPESAFYMLHMAYDSAFPGGQSNTTDPTNCIVTVAGLPV